MKIRTQVALTFFGLFALTLISFGLYDFHEHCQMIQADTFHHLNIAASTQKKLMESFFLANLEKLLLMTSRTQLKVSLARYNQTQEAPSLQKIHKILQASLNATPSFNSISILNLQGQILASTEATLVGTDHAQQDFFVQGQTQPQEDYFVLDESQNLNIRFSGPLVLDGQLLGVLLIEADAKNFIDLMDDASLGESGELALVQKNKGGAIVFINPLRFDPAEALRVVANPDPQSPAWQAFEREEKQMAGKNYRQEPVYAVTKRLQNLHWAIVASVPQSEMQNQLKTLRNQLFVAALLVMGVAFFVSWLVANFLTKPLSNLTKTVVQIAQGDWQREIKSSSATNEIGLLAQSLNQMKNTFFQSLEEVRQVNQELQTVNANLKTAQAQLMQATKLASLGEMATGIAHELSQPLQIIQMSMELGKEDIAAQNYKGATEHFAIIERQIDRAATIISHLKAFGRKTSSAQLKEVSINQIIEDSLILIDNLFRNQNIALVKELANGLPWIRGNSIQLEQVLLNLLLNARDALRERPEKIIKIRSWKEEQHLKIEIEDNGLGMEEAIQNQIFDPFFTTKEEGEGTGLGLSISHSIIQQHQGTLQVRSVSQQGTVFTISLPIAP